MSSPPPAPFCLDSSDSGTKVLWANLDIIFQSSAFGFKDFLRHCCLNLALISYSILRIFSENFREPDQHLGYLFNYFSMGTLLSILTLISGFLIIFFIKKNEQNN